MLEVFPLHFISSEEVTLCVIQVTLNNLMLLFNLATVALKTPLMQERGYLKRYIVGIIPHYTKEMHFLCRAHGIGRGISEFLS